MRKIDSVTVSLYLRILFFSLFASVPIGLAYLYKHGSCKLLLLLLPISFLLPFPIMLLLDRMSNFLTAFYSGGNKEASLAEQLAGEVTKARHLKAEKRFAEALHSANWILEKMPEHAEALLLKAQILSEGFSNSTAAKACLKKIIRLESVPDEKIRQWAKGLLEEIVEHEQT